MKSLYIKWGISPNLVTGQNVTFTVKKSSMTPLNTARNSKLPSVVIYVILERTIPANKLEITDVIQPNI